MRYKCAENRTGFLYDKKNFLHKWRFFFLNQRQRWRTRVCLHAGDTCCGSVGARCLKCRCHSWWRALNPATAAMLLFTQRRWALQPPLSGGEVEWHPYYGDAKYTMVSQHNAGALHSLLCFVTLFMERGGEEVEVGGGSIPREGPEKLCEKVQLQLLFALTLTGSLVFS